MNIGKVIRAERESKGITRVAYAQLLKIKSASLWKIEAGRCWPNQKTLKRFMEVSGYPVARLYIEALEPQDY